VAANRVSAGGLPIAPPRKERLAEWDRIQGDVPIRRGGSAICLAFSDLRDRVTVAVRDHVAQALRGKSTGLVGFPAEPASPGANDTREEYLRSFHRQRRDMEPVMMVASYSRGPLESASGRRGLCGWAPSPRRVPLVEEGLRACCLEEVIPSNRAIA